MQINGFQKLTLLDYPGKVACTLFTAGCNLRCPFCHNASLVINPDMSHGISTEEILDYLKKRQGILEGVCISGGEPLLQPDIKDFMKQIKELGYAVKLDTNGCFPEKLMDLVNSGLIDYVAMDIKNCKNKYGLTVGIENFDITPIEKSVEFLKEGHVDYEFRTTVVKELHNVDDIQDIGVWLKGATRCFVQNFVDSGELIQNGLNPVDSAVLEEMKSKLNQNIGQVELRGV